MNFNDRIVYFVRKGENVKIGITQHMISRWQVLRFQFGKDIHFIKAISGTLATERWFHKHFADRHVEREWFNVTESEIDVAIAAYANGQDIQVIAGLPTEALSREEKARQQYTTVARQ